MVFTSAQKALVKADILAQSDLNSQPHNADGAFAIADLYNLSASPDYWVWRTSVPVTEIYSITTVDGTTWNWTTYIGRSVAERDCWREVTSSEIVNLSLANMRQAVADIFSGVAAAAVNQRAHILTVGRRKTTRLEKLLATGTGSTASPATLGFEGLIAYGDIIDARDN